MHLGVTPWPGRRPSIDMMLHVVCTVPGSNPASGVYGVSRQRTGRIALARKRKFWCWFWSVLALLSKSSLTEPSRRRRLMPKSSRYLVLCWLPVLLCNPHLRTPAQWRDCTVSAACCMAEQQAAYPHAPCSPFHRNQKRTECADLLLAC